MTKRAEYQIAWQKENRVEYAYVDLSIENSKENTIEVKFNESVEPKWKVPVKFGVSLFFDETQIIEEGKGLTINILEVRWQPVDTSVMSVAFSTYKALCNAFDTVSEKFRFNEELGEFSF